MIDPRDPAPPAPTSRIGIRPSPSSELAALGLCRAAEAIARGETSCVDYALALLAAIERTRSTNAWLHVDAGRLLEAAAHADDLRDGCGPLHGVPLALKDNIDVAGVPTTAGSPALRAHVPRRDSVVAQRLLEAGALVLGKTNLHEFALGVTSDNAAFGAVRNPHAPDRIAGGSSGGAAAAVAAFAAPAAIGTDTGGSIRIPAALCGVVGFRPSTGRWPTDGIVPLSWTRDTPGPIARSVADCALLDAVVVGGVVHHARARAAHGAGATTPGAARLRELRVGLPPQRFLAPLDAGLAEVVDAALACLRAAGATLVPCEIDDVDALTHATGMTIAQHETPQALRAYFTRHALAFDAAALVAAIASPEVRAAFEDIFRDSPIRASTYRRAMRDLRPALQRAWQRCFEMHRLDVLLYPTTALPAARIGEEFVQIGNERMPVFFAYIRNTEPGTVVGAPGLSLPVGATRSGLPVGLAVDARPGDDGHLLQVGMSLEACFTAGPAQR
jgi:mandelamide amidase